ncbi:hypothetical protein Tco_0227330 [Tanacetum coccineum]
MLDGKILNLDEAKRRNSGAKAKTFEQNYYLLPYAVSSKEDTAYQRQLITRKRVRSIPNPAYHSSPIRRISSWSSVKGTNPYLPCNTFNIDRVINRPIGCVMRMRNRDRIVDNAFNGMDGGDITDHITKVLEFTEWIKMPNVKKIYYDYTSSQICSWWRCLEMENDELNGTTIDLE